MKKHLFIFTIGPVQSFIAQARKTQDLYAGSQLLSDLIDFAMKEVQSKGEVIFPFAGATSKPNRFVAKISSDDIKKTGNDLQIAVKEKLLSIAEDAFKEKPTFYAIAEAQLEDFLESYWAAIIYDENKDYNEQYKELERTLGAVKNYRAYSQFSEQGRKCAVNGFYNALFYRRKEKENDSENILKERKYLPSNALIIRDSDRVGLGELQHGEGVCGLTFLKRHYKAQQTFPSVANIALMHLWQNETIRKSLELEQMLICDNKSMRTIDAFNGQLLYSENINEAFFKEQDTKCTWECADESLKKLTKLVKKEGLKFIKYYAAIVFDADGMGEKLSACTTIKEHQDLSQKLSDYANWARDYVDNGRGKAIYAGGDDFMGLLNLTTLFETIEKLRKEFGERFEAEKMTFSAGIAIAHYKTPLDEVLNYARKMEHKAKKQDKKNSFAIAVMKHSGEVHETVLPWINTLDGERKGEWNTQYLTNTYLKLKEGVSPAFIKNLYEILSVWEDSPKAFRKQSNHEIKRFIGRASRGLNTEVLIKEVTELYRQVSVKEETNAHFINALNITDFINRKL
jgi:CRISPR-associated protein Cmr2